MTFKPEELKVDDKVGVNPPGMTESPYPIATVFKVLKTQITVKYDNGKMHKFIRNTGREYSGDQWHPARLVSVAEANEANALIIPRQKRRVTLYKLSDRLKGAGADTFTQQQLDVVMMALGDVGEQATNNCGKPMDSAPKDGTHILAYGTHEDDCGERNVGFCEVYYNGMHGWYNITNYPSYPEFWLPLLCGHERNSEGE